MQKTNQFLIQKNLLILALWSIHFFVSAQHKNNKKHTSIYKTEFQKFRKNNYNLFLISKSNTKPNKNWNNYKGGAINTTDSLFFFNDDLLAKAFPTNSDKIRNKYLAFYFSQKTAKCPTLFSLLNYYEPTINNNITLNKLPKELKLLPAVLSAFNPNSDNGIGGYGFWHLNYPQAIKYGLTVNNLIDERKDFKKSTKAATRYLKDLYQIYNNWELTLTAYSSGVVTVEKLLKRHQAKTYKEIYPFLPKQTKELVQAFVAMNYIYNYDTYGAVALNPTIEADTVKIERKLKFEAVNHVIKTNNKDFKLLNPTLNKAIFAANYVAYFPKGIGEKFTEMKDSIYFYQDSVLLKPKKDEPDFVIPKNGEPYVYTVKSGDVLGLIASRNNVRVSQLQDWNGLSGTRINIGQKLTIYGKSSKIEVKSQKKEEKSVKLGIESKKKKNIKSSISSPQKNTLKEKKTQTTETLTLYTVKSGDNLWVIAKKYSGVSAQNIIDFNGIDGNLTVGQKIKIPKY
ncbi:MAG: LysM peptidoglycan-binding domain-containing protein [Vicingaceae bacterium]